VRIPQLGLGTSPLNDEQVAWAVVAAVEAGYRSIDTAEKYGNEIGVGEGIRVSGLPRDEVFITTKLDGKFQGADRALRGADGSLARLRVDYVDLLLIHWPLPQRDLYIDTWRTFEKLLGEGKTRAIGVSNFKPAHLDRLLAETDVVPAVNQIQINPYVPREDQRRYNADKGIATESYSPLGAGNELLESSVVKDIATEHGKTPGQVVLRWHIERGLIPIPRSGNPERIAQNIDIFDFALTEAQVAALTALDRGPGAGVDSDIDGH
jgi:2,5-diketo-D-gluconate reductase A